MKISTNVIVKMVSQVNLNIFNNDTCSFCIYLGTNCEYNIDDCAKSPCKNGGTCIDLINDVQCKCMEGYKGKLCEIDIDECALFPVSRLFKQTEQTHIRSKIHYLCCLEYLWKQRPLQESDQ